jgi:Lantibiotic biosynthesis dehydratase C-term/Lantibiotic dehydratase, N terminus
MAVRYRHHGIALVRSTTDPGDLDVPQDLSLNDPEAVEAEGQAWLAKTWARGEVREAVGAASPVLAARVTQLLASPGHASTRDLRRVIVSLASYLMRWQRRVAPFGLFAGVLPATAGPAGATIGTAHRAVARPVPQWIAVLEAAAFGGTAGMGIAHDLFCNDTSGFLAYARQDKPQLGRHEISVMLVSAMLADAGLDSYERGDIFARVAAMRPEPAPGTTAQQAQLAGQLRTLLATPAAVTSTLFFEGDNSGAAARWHAGFTDAGRRFAVASSSGTLSRGLRAILAHTVIFHWNRLGLSATSQAVLARAAALAFLPAD